MISVTRPIAAPSVRSHGQLLNPRFLAALLLAFALASAGGVLAGDLPTPSGRALLSSSGDIAHSNADGEARFDRAMLEALGVHRLRTKTAWTEEASEFAGPLPRDLLDLSKLEAGHMQLNFEQVSLAELVEIAAEEFGSLCRDKALHVDIDCEEVLPMLSADPERLLQALRNLLSNSIEFSPPGGGIRICLSCAAGARVVLHVDDEGPGIPDAELEQVFEKFTQSSSTSVAAGGTGLGLAICRQIVLLHGGEISTENRPDSGSRFTVVLPVAGDLVRRAA